MLATTHEYQDFDLLLEPIETGVGYSARVLRSPCGEASAKFEFPFSKTELEIFLLSIGQSKRGVRRGRPRELDSAQAFGAKLFETVFTADVLTALETSRSDKHGLRIRLRMNQAPELAQLPWEFLFHKSLNQFLALDHETPIVRYLELKKSNSSLTVNGPIRILVVVSSPLNSLKLDTNDELKRLRRALRDLRKAGKVIIELLPKATTESLRHRLQGPEVHVLHFIGHGEFDPELGAGTLLFETKNRERDDVSGDNLAACLHNHGSLRLAVINACEGGRSDRDDAFAGVAQVLMRGGLPAVIAMQFSISDMAARVFATNFYTALANGYPIDAAMAETRTALYVERKQLGAEWGTPVLYMRAPDGKLFDFPTNRVISPILNTWVVFGKILEILSIAVAAILVFGPFAGVLLATSQNSHAQIGALLRESLRSHGYLYLIFYLLSITGYGVLRNWPIGPVRKVTLRIALLSAMLFSAATRSTDRFGAVYEILRSSADSQISGQIVSNSTEKPISNAKLLFVADGRPLADLGVNDQGRFTFILSPLSSVHQLSVQISAPHFHPRLIDDISKFGPSPILTLIPDEDPQPSLEPFESSMMFGGFPLNVGISSGVYKLGLSSVQSDASVWGDEIRIKSVAIKVSFTTLRPLASVNAWVLLGPRRFGLAPGSVENVWIPDRFSVKLTSDVAPTQYRFVLGNGKPSPSDKEQQSFSGTFKFGDPEAVGNVIAMKEVFGPVVNAPHGLFAQIYFWTAEEGANLNIEGASIIITGLKSTTE